MQTQLFKLPIQLESLIPEFIKQLPPAHLLQLYQRIEQLKQKLSTMIEYHDHLEKFLAKEKNISDISKLIQDGQENIGKISHWVGAMYPKNSVDPNGKKARELLAYTMKWYIDMVTAWDEALDQKCC